MTEKLQSGLAPGGEIETSSEKTILLTFIKENWDMSADGAMYDTNKIDWGAHPSRTTKGITINCYRIFSNVYDKDVGSHVYYFDVPIAIDVYLRDVRAEGQKNEPSPKLIKIENYLRQFLLINRTGLRNKGINNLMITASSYPEEPAPEGAEKQRVWYHLVMEVRFRYHMFRVPV